MHTNSSETKNPLQNQQWRGLLFSLLLFAFFSAVAADAQTHREWRDTTLPEMRTPRRLGGAGQPSYPIGLFVYAGDYNRPFWEVVPYLNSTGIDHIIQNVQKGYDGYRQVYNWDRYLELLDSLEGSNKRIIPLIGYGGENDRRSYVVEAEKGREITFFPFDSSQMRRWEVYENLFTSYQYDLLQENPLDEYRHDSVNHFREAVYDTGLADQTVASGIAFDYRPGQTIRWNQYNDTGLWHTTANPINSTALFEKIDYGWRDTANHLHGDHHHTHRTPHYIVVTGHLFQFGTLHSDSAILRVNVWYEVDKGKIYRDSANVYRTADTNLRFLYKTIEITKGELEPADPGQPNWNAYREAVKQISFQREGMGGPTDTNVTAQRFDLEVVYLGGEKLALRSVALRDSITHLLTDPGSAGNTYRQNIERELDTLVRYYATSNLLRPAIYNLNIADEPPYMQFAGFRRTKPLIEQSFIAGGTDTLTTLNGTALPFIQWLGDADWVVSGNYLGNNFYRLGNDFNLNRTVDTGLVRYQDVPSVKQHNGGKWHIAELFDFDSLGSATYAATLPERIEHAELLWNHARMGAAAPGQNLDDRILRSWRVRGLYESAALSRDMGRPFQNYIGPISNISISFQQQDVENGLPVTGYDTNCDHRFERAELRTILRLGLAYGARGLTFYKLPTYPWGKVDPRSDSGHSAGHMLITEEIALSGFTGIDTVNNFIDWTVRNAKVIDTVIDGQIINDSLGVVPGLYTGFRNTYREIRESVPWVRQMGEFMTRLRWRDAYSLHFQTDLPDNNYDSALVHRPLPPGEIITELTARHPVTGAVDSAWATYVELGLFQTVIDTAGGVRNRWKDTNYVFVVNRRMFETGNYDTADIPYSAGVKALLDTLSETRLISLKLNLLDYYLENNQYQYLHVRQVLPDTAPLPLLGTPHLLDTIVTATGTVEVLLGAGRGTLLEITRVRPDEAVADGMLTRNNQRKLVYDPLSHTYFSTFHRYDSSAADWHVYFRRSLPMTDTIGSILWEPFEWAISTKMQGEDQARTLNTHPSLTYRYLPSGAVRVSVVWTAHPAASGHAATEREVLMRDMTYQTYLDGLGDTVTVMHSTPLRTVGFHYGSDGEKWGTPVLSSAGFGEYVAWSDSTVGIVARGRLLDTAVVFLPAWTPLDTVNLFWTDTIGMPPGQYPAMPPFTHRALNDSSAGIVWQQQWPPYTGIFYGRLYYTPPPSGPAIRIDYPITGDLFLSPHANLGANTQQHLHPSIDQSQDGLGRVMEGVTWERNYYIAHQDNYITDIFFRSILFDTASQMPTVIGNWIVRTDATFDYDPGYGYPVVSSQNQVLTPADSNKVPLFSVVYMKDYYVEPMSVIDAKWIYATTPQWRTAQAQDYTFGGTHPSGAASQGGLSERYAALYRRDDDNKLRTSREFFSRTRPGGYQAEGVEVWGIVDSSSGLSVGARLYDVWKSDGYSSAPLGLVPFSSPDSLHALLGLLRTRPFETSDSVEIGGTIHVQLFGGDESAASGTDVLCLMELIDSATGEAVAVLDSFAVAPDNREVYAEVRGIADVLSGDYYVRLRLEWEGVETNVALDGSVRKSVGYVYGWVGGLGAKRVQRLEGEAGSRLRLNAQPNPFGKETEIRFSVPRREYVTVTLYDVLGRKVRTLAERELYEAGRYGVELESGNLLPGTYLVELRTGRERITEKVLLKH